MAKNWLKVTLFLFALWLVLSGHFEAKYIILGFVSAAVISYISLPGFSIKGRETGSRVSLFTINPIRFAGYWLWLLFEIAKASLSVAKAIVSPRMHINPQIIKFRCAYQNPIAVTMLVNSIILTPGTVTIDVEEEDCFVVHALTDAAAEGLMEGGMQKRIGRLFGETIEIGRTDHESII